MLAVTGQRYCGYDSTNGASKNIGDQLMLNGGDRCNILSMIKKGNLARDVPAGSAAAMARYSALKLVGFAEHSLMAAYSGRLEGRTREHDLANTR